jgi:hypothetical protein
MPALGFLSIGAVDVEVSEMRLLTAVTTGETTRAYDRTLRTTRQPATKREYQATTRPLTTTEQAALRAACAFGTNVSVAGSAILGGALTAKIEEGDSSYVIAPADTDGWEAPITLTIREV